MQVLKKTRLLGALKCVCALLSLLLLTFSFLFLQGCGESKSTKTYSVEQTSDVVGNILTGCEEEVSETSSGSTKVVVKYKDYTVSGTTTKLPYEEWVAAGRPVNDAGYIYYFMYTPTGDEHALLYKNNEDACLSIAVKKRNGNGYCKMLVGMDGEFLLKNPVNGDTVDRDEMERDYKYYHEEASRIVQALDPDFLYKLDTASNISRNEL